MKILLTWLLSATWVAVVESSDNVLIDHCDASKCRSSPGIFGDSHDCWFVARENETVTWKPAACAEEYEARDLSNVTVLHDPASGSTFGLFDCCPPNISSQVLVQCTDAACSSVGPHADQSDCWADGPNEPMTCGGDEFPFPRKTGGRINYDSRWYSHYICCERSDGTPPLQHSLVVAESWRAAIGGIGLLLNLTLISAILISPNSRAQTYNLYIVALEVPDVIFNILSIAVGCLNVLAFISTPWSVINYLTVFYSAANIWLGMLVAHQIYILLRNSHNRQRTPPPSNRTVTVQVAGTYFLAALMAAWFAILRAGVIEYLGRYAPKTRGVSALALSYVVLAVVPFLYQVYICVRVWRGGLLPLSGRTKALSFYFLRIIVSFFAMWIPSIVIVNFERQNVDRPLHYIAWYMCSAQSVVTFVVALTKPDVRAAVMNLVTCRCITADITAVAPLDQYTQRCSSRLSYFGRQLLSGSLMSSLKDSTRRALDITNASADGHGIAVEESNSAHDRVGVGKDQFDEEQANENEKANRESKVRFAPDVLKTIKSGHEDDDEVSLQSFSDYA